MNSQSRFCKIGNNDDFHDFIAIEKISEYKIGRAQWLTTKFICKRCFNTFDLDFFEKYKTDK
jgi:hypothetical protein